MRRTTSGSGVGISGFLHLVIHRHSHCGFDPNSTFFFYSGIFEDVDFSTKKKNYIGYLKHLDIYCIYFLENNISKTVFF